MSIYFVLHIYNSSFYKGGNVTITIKDTTIPMTMKTGPADLRADLTPCTTRCIGAVEGRTRIPGTEGETGRGTGKEKRTVDPEIHTTLTTTCL